MTKRLVETFVTTNLIMSTSQAMVPSFDIIRPFVMVLAHAHLIRLDMADGTVTVNSWSMLAVQP